MVSLWRERSDRLGRLVTSRLHKAKQCRDQADDSRPSPGQRRKRPHGGEVYRRSVGPDAQRQSSKGVAGFKKKMTSINHAQCACLVADFPVAMNAIEGQVPKVIDAKRQAGAC